MVLLVEDEPFIRMGTAYALSEEGFVVLEAQDAAEALSIEATCQRIDLLFTDVNLGGELDGIALSRIVENRRPDVRLVVTSGERRIEDEDLPDSGVFLPKPYRTEHACELLHKQLAR